MQDEALEPPASRRRFTASLLSNASRVSTPLSRSSAYSGTIIPHPKEEGVNGGDYNILYLFILNEYHINTWNRRLMQHLEPSSKSTHVLNIWDYAFQETRNGP